MAPTIVYRFEHPEDRQGPWTSQHGLSWGDRLDASSMPTDYRDVERVHYAGQCGVVTPQQLRWFTSRDRKILGERGFVLSTYMCPPGTVDYGEQQVCFAIDHAVRLKERVL